ncbi:AI-2E family transporter [Pseudoduganella umbonata]|uniref:AI-2E family transporter n=1 Tax=Pseudoduganella umbonata TaxID=864828 RepID=A0A4P8HNX6_9BURK|nr:AI-2E family transporter [Pseudoduganella umbonata]MBB3222719.1 putative PurR-regulated permease PerM [Pseudoduganella umbonata]QCP10786.1 AI-2E family transporter [Pseudoduganella umbonata]
MFLKRPSNFLLTVTCAIALLHFGREVLQPITLALVLSLALAPLIRAIASLGLSRTFATFTALVVAISALVGAAVVLVAQLYALTADLPQYRAEIRAKLKEVQVLTERPLSRLPTELLEGVPAAPATGTSLRARRGTTQPVPVVIREPTSTQDSLTRAIGVVSGPLGTVGLVLVLLVFILLDQENLRDRLVRLAGQREVSRTLRGLEDAAHGVSRFFFSQFIVNIVFGAVIGAILWLLGIPHAVLWAALCAVLRFVPYIGALIAGGAIALFAAAVDPGWSLALLALGLFVALEVVLANVIEPRVYGHSSGMSPLAVIVSALFWSAVWGPVGLLLSTPLTLCLVVAGRYIKSLEPVTILLAESPDASAAQRFFHRALSGDAAAIIGDARVFLRKSTLARYCDQVMLPGLALAIGDLRGGATDKVQEGRLRATIALVADTLAAGKHMGRARRLNVSMLNESIGAHLRHLREERLGRWQGSLDVPARSIVLSVGFANIREEFRSELLVLALREAGIDARSITLDDDDDGEARPDAEHLVSTVFVVYPIDTAFGPWCEAVAALRENLPDVPLVTIRPREDAQADPAQVAERVDMVLQSFEEALAFVAPVKAAKPAKA